MMPFDNLLRNVDKTILIRVVKFCINCSLRIVNIRMQLLPEGISFWCCDVKPNFVGNPGDLFFRTHIDTSALFRHNSCILYRNTETFILAVSNPVLNLRKSV